MLKYKISKMNNAHFSILSFGKLFYNVNRFSHLFMYLFDMIILEKETKKYLIHWFIPYCPAQSGMGQAEIRIQLLNPSFPHRWQEPNYLNPHHYLPGYASARIGSRSQT